MTGGVKAALDAAVDQMPDGQQLVQAALFDLDATQIGANDAPSPLSRLFEPKRRGPGRRPGSKNRRTEEVAAYLLSQHRHPLLVMMEAYSMTPGELLARIGIVDPDADQLMEAFKLQVRMAEAVAPYVAQKLPQAVQVDAKGGVTLQFGGVSLGGVSVPARGGVAENSDTVDGEVMGVRLPMKSDD